MKQTLIKIIAGALVMATLVPTAVSCISDENAETTTTTSNENEEPLRDTEALLADSTYASTGLEYALKICQTYYEERGHTIKRSLTNANAAEIWYVASYIEMLAEAYKLYPDNATIKKYYLYALDKALPQYIVENAIIKTPSKTYRGLTYYNAGRNSMGDFYYDDNAWICWQLFEAYELLGESKYLAQAEAVLEFLWAGWRENGGGIYWSKDFGNIGTCASAPTVCCLLRGYQLTQKQEYFDNAVQLYDWLNENVLQANTGLYYAGQGDPWQPSYDQGTMILSSSMLYEITGEEKYYDYAKKTASRCVTHSFTIEGTRKEYIVKINENPYYCSWAFSWLVRGISKYIEVSDKKNELFMTYLKKLLDTRVGTQNKKTGQYDHYFGTASDGWIGKGKMFESDDLLLMPTGYASMLLLVGYFDVYISQEVLSE